MRKLLRSRRGSVTFATVIALVPLIGFLALGAEAGQWYVTKQNAQNAADAAAFSGALSLACSLSVGNTCDRTQDYVYRAKQWAAKNAFCNAGDSSYPGSTCGGSLPANTTRTVSIDRGTYAAGAWSGSASGNFVLATVSQQQPGYLAAVLGLSSVTIAAQAVAQIANPKDVCGFGLNGMTIGGSSALSGGGCALMTNGAIKLNSAPTFTGTDWAIDAAGGCNASAGHCSLSVPFNYNMLPATIPIALQTLDSESFNSRTGPATDKCGSGTGNLTVNNGNTCSLLPNSAGGVYTGNLKVNSGGTLTFQSGGTYFFYNATLTFSGTATGTGVTLVLLGNSSLSMSGTVNLSAPATNSFSADLNGILIDDQATGSVSIGGSGVIKLGGVMYFPKADVSYGGTSQSTSTTCTEVVAKTLTITGNAYLDSNNCASGTVSKTQVIAMVY